MRADDLMTPEPRVVTPQEPVVAAAEIMRDAGVGCVPVVEDRNSMRLSGVITDRDIAVRHVAARHDSNCRVGDHMTTGPLDTVEPETDLSLVMEMMERDQVRRIMVTRGDRLLGIVSQADLILKEGPVEPVRVEQVLERVSAPSMPLA